jgi:protein-tyrosine-phosphatase
MNDIDLYIQNLIEEVRFSVTDQGRQLILQSISEYLTKKAKSGDEANLMFVCTHNSRRSQLAQVWAILLSEKLNVKNLDFYSAGTETTAFHPNAVGTLQRSGVNIITDEVGANPKYFLNELEGFQNQRFWSKAIGDPSLPKKDFAAIMVCSDADVNCPMVPGAEERFSLTFDDPKISDGKRDSDQVYDKRSRQIALDIARIFSSVETA